MIKPTVQAFLNALEINRDQMIQDRNSMTEIEFWNLWNVSPVTVVKYMWYWTKESKKKVILDPVEINKLRWTMTDKQIRAKFNTSTLNINQTCWSRESQWIPKFICWKEIEKPVEVEEIKKEIVFDHDYWKVWEILEVGSRAIPFVYSKIK